MKIKSNIKFLWMGAYVFVISSIWAAPFARAAPFAWADPFAWVDQKAQRWSLEFGVQNTFHYNRQYDSFLTPPEIFFFVTQLGYQVSPNLKFVAEYDVDIGTVAASAYFFGIRPQVFQVALGRSPSRFFNTLVCSVVVDFGVRIIEPPIPPKVYKERETIFRVGPSLVFTLGKGGTYLNLYGLFYQTSDTNKMLAAGLNFGFFL